MELTHHGFESKLKEKLASEAGWSLAESAHVRQCTLNGAPVTSPRGKRVCMCANLDPEAMDR